MQKYLKYLEQYVQWIAIALGAAYLLYMVYGYAVQPPVKVAGKPLSPSELPKLIADGPARQLEDAMRNRTVPNKDVQPFAPHFGKTMAWQDQPSMRLALPWINSVTQTAKTEEAKVDTNVGDQVVKLPELPAAKFKAFSAGHSVVSIPTGSTPDAKSQPVASPAGETTQDCQWVTASFVIPMPDVVKAFDETNIPAVLRNNTMFLRIELLRQEMQADGSWGAESVIKPLAIHEQPPFPSDHREDQLHYVDWASKNAADIIAPSFYRWVKPDAWYAPGQPNPNEAVATPAEQAMDAATQARLLAEKKAADIAERQRKAAERTARAARTSRTPTRNSRNPSMEPSMPGTPTMPPAMPSAPPAMPPSLPPAMVNGMPTPSPLPPNPLNPSMTPGGPMGFAPTGPAGGFNPATLGDVEVWAHDDTVQPGKTYRYKLHYKLKNPVFLSTNVAEPLSLADELAIDGKDGQWSDPITIKSATTFFLASGLPLRDGNATRIDVFAWKGGLWQRKTITLSAGDLIEGTDWTLVDLRMAPGHEMRAVLSNDNGSLSIHDSKTDQADPEYLRLKKLTDAARAPTGPAAMP